MLHQDYTSVQSLKRYLKHAQRCGVDSEPLLRQAGIDPSLIDDNTLRIPNQQLLDYLLQAIPASGDPCFGLNTSQHLQADTFDILGFIALNCANLREAMNQVMVFEKINGDAGRTELIEQNQDVLIAWHCQVEEPVVRRHLIENVIASWFLYARKIVNVDDKPKAIWFEHSAPFENSSAGKNKAAGASAQLKQYEKLFESPVLFNQPFSGILIKAEQLQTPFPQANADILAALQRSANEQLSRIDHNQSFSHKVSNRIRLMLARGIPSKELIAEQLGISARTLQRHLSDEGENYKDLLQNIRRELAGHYLTRTNMSTEDIARQLGFTDARSFQRSFKQWTGKTPGSLRKKQ